MREKTKGLKKIRKEIGLTKEEVNDAFKFFIKNAKDNSDFVRNIKEIYSEGYDWHYVNKKDFLMVIDFWMENKLRKDMLNTPLVGYSAILTTHEKEGEVLIDNKEAVEGLRNDIMRYKSIEEAYENFARNSLLSYCRRQLSDEESYDDLDVDYD